MDSLGAQSMTNPPAVKHLRVKLFADGADRASMLALYARPEIEGFTTNPTLMAKAGITDYEAFSRDILATIADKPLSLEVFSDDFAEMERQARKIAAWGGNVYVKIPITNTRGESSGPLIKRLAHSGLKLNVTAITTLQQVRQALASLDPAVPAYLSVFAGRIADTGRDPVPMVEESLALARSHPLVEMIWASPRELLNIFHADRAGCHIITVTADILAKLTRVGLDPEDGSLETVKMFYDDAVRAGFTL